MIIYLLLFDTKECDFFKNKHLYIFDSLCLYAGAEADISGKGGKLIQVVIYLFIVATKQQTTRKIFCKEIIS